MRVVRSNSLKIVFAWWVWACCYLIGYGQAELNRFRHISTSGDFTINPITDIQQDQRGHLWFGTRHGLLRHDGLQLRQYLVKNENAVRSGPNDVNEILIARSGKIWVATHDGLYLFDPVTLRFTRLDRQPAWQRAEINASTHSLLEARDGAIWVGTRTGLYRYSPGDDSVREVRTGGKNTGFVRVLHQSRRGEVWAGTRRGLYRFGVDGATLSEYSTELSDLRVSSLREDENGNLWVGTHRGLDYLDVSRQKIRADHRIPDIFVRSMTVDSSQRLWIGTFDGILVREASGNLRTVRHELANPNSLPDNKIRALFTDSNGTVWVGTYYGGINTWHENQLNFARIDEANGRHLSRRVVSSLAEDENGRLYFGTEGEGVTVLDPATDTYRYLGRRSGQQRIGTVKALAYREKRGLWIGTYDRGLMHYDPTDERIVRLRHDPEDQETPSTDGILSLCATPEDLWIGSVNGALDRLRFSDGRLTRLAGEKATGLGLGVGSIRALATNDTGNLFFGTTQGVYRIAREDIRTETYALKPLSLPAGMESSLYVQDIVAGPNGTVWVATLQRGLYRIVGDTLERVELPGVSSLFAIVTVASDQIWLSSKEGLIHYDPGTGERRIFAARDGVPRNEFGHGAGLYTSSGKLFFGGASGATVFTPQRLGQWDDYAPDVVITDLKLSGRPVLPGDSTGLLTVAIDRTEELEFAYDQNDFTFHFALPNFVRTEQNTYYYRLLGLDDEWTKTSRPEVTYTIQRGGNYVFEVRGENSYGVPTAAITRLPLRVHPPPWRSWWAYLLYASIILGTILTLILMYRGRIRLQHAIEMDQREHRRQQEVNAQKLRFFTNISHEFRTPLTLISGSLERLLDGFTGSSRVYRQLQVIKKNSDQLYRLINELMDFRKLETRQTTLQAAEGNIVDFAREVHLSFRPAAREKNIRFPFRYPAEDIRLFYDRDKLEKVLYNLLSNALKFTPVGGEVTLRLWEEKDAVLLSVKDTGPGIAPADRERIFDRYYEGARTNDAAVYRPGTGIGLAIVRNVVELHRGKVAVISTPETGSDFRVHLPRGRTHLEDGEIIPDFRGSENREHYRLPAANSVPLLPPEEVLPESDKQEQPLVLVAEDNPDVSAFMHEVLGVHYRVEMVENGKAGYERAIAGQPELIVSDVMMPEMDGISFCTRVKEDLRTSHIPFILLTARTALVHKYEGLESGADDYLGKPFRVKELLLKCHNLIVSRRRLREKFRTDGLPVTAEHPHSSLDEEMMQRALAVIRDKLGEEHLNIPLLCEELGVSRSVLFAKFRAWTDQTPKEYIVAARMRRAARLLESGKYQVSEVCYRVGYRTPSYFGKAFRKHFSLSPREYAERFTGSGAQKA